MKPVPYREVKRKLEQAGFVAVSQKGSHVKFIRELESEVWTVIVPCHREVSSGTMRSILRQSGLSVDVFEDL
jgi:predicted RNA binding protein YcfA (HicA-like mRNA interferase family)